MGVDYFNCHECNEILCDGGGDYDTFEIEGMNGISVCESCAEELRSSLTLAEPWTDYFLIATSSGTRIVCKYYDEVQAFVNVNPDSRIGLYDGMNDQLVTAWTGAVTTTVADITDEHLKPDGWTCKLVGWREHQVKEYPHRYKHELSWCNHKHKDIFFDTREEGVSLSYIQTYAQKHNLVHTPIIVDTDYKAVNLFCNPDDISVHWFDSLQDADEARSSGTYTSSRSDVCWKPSTSYIQNQIAKIQEEIQQKQQAINDLLQLAVDIKSS